MTHDVKGLNGFQAGDSDVTYIHDKTSNFCVSLSNLTWLCYKLAGGYPEGNE